MRKYGTYISIGVNRYLINLEALHIAKILLYREGGGILCYVCYILHNNHVLGNALLHVRKHQQDAFIYTSLLTFFCKILLARLNEIVTCKS